MDFSIMYVKPIQMDHRVMFVENIKLLTKLLIWVMANEG